MRKSNMRKWFHLIIDFIPLFIIPIFAININQKSVEPISITIQETWSETIPLYESNEIENANDLVEGNIYKFTIDEQPSITGYKNILDCYAVYNLNALDYITVDSTTDSNYLKIRLTTYAIVVMGTNSQNICTIAYDYITFPYSFELVYKQILDNDITYENFEYTEYQVYETNYYEDEPKVYDNTDIGSQFLYSLYKPVHDYFNISELGGFKQFYQWIKTNMFNGTAPLPFFIVFNIMMYNFIVDLIFLLYSVFMFFIDFAEKCFDRFYGRSNN